MDVQLPEGDGPTCKPTQPEGKISTADCVKAA